jgi:3-oxoadipate enol-lactonase
MPTIEVDGCPLNVEVEGREGAPVLMLGNSLGTDLHMWDDQAAEFAKHFRLIRHDRRGHGKSGASKGPYSFDLFGRDILAIMDALKIKTMNWCGLSMGGMDGQWLGANAPDRVEKLVLANTNFYYADKGPWADRIQAVHEKGLASFVDANMERWFTKGFIWRAPQAIERLKKTFLASNPDGYAACVGAVRDIDFRESNPRITAPTLVIVGTHDPATPPERGREMAEKQIKAAKLVELDAAHISNVEQPRAFTEAVLNFLR